MSLTTDFWTLIPAANGIEYSGYPAGNPPVPTWSVIPNQIALTASFSVNVKTTYLTPTVGPTVTLNGSLPTGWTFDGTTLAYNGTSVGGPATLSFTASYLGSIAPSNSFSVSGIGGVGADSLAPTIPLGIAASGISTTTATLSGLASSDPAPVTQQSTGLLQYNVAVTGAPGSPFTVASVAGNKPALTFGDIGVQTSTITQSGADLSFTTTAQDAPYPTNSALAYAYQQVTGTSWIASAKVSAFTSSNPFSNWRIEVRSDLTPTGPYIACISTPFAGAKGVSSEFRGTVGGSAANLASGANSTTPVWLFMQRSGDTYSMYYSINGNTLISLGSRVQVLGSAVYIGFGANSADGSSVAVTIQQTNIQTAPGWSLNLTGLTIGTSYPVTVTAQDNSSNISAASAAFTFNTTQAVVGAKPFPRFGVQCFIANQLPTAATIPALAAYPYIQLSGIFQSNVTPPKLTRDQIVTGLKTQPASGKTAVTPFVIQYQDLNEIYNNGQTAVPAWYAACNTNNWWLYNIGSSGTKTPSAIGPSLWLCDFAIVAGVQKDVATNLYAYEWAAQYIYNSFYTGGGLATDTNAAYQASSSLDGFYLDNAAVRHIQGNAADWLRNGTSQGLSDAASIAASTLGLQKFAQKGYALNPNLLWCGNTSFSYDTLPAGNGGLGLNGSNVYQQFAFPMEQNVWGSVNSSPPPLINFQSPATCMLWYKTIQGSAKTGTNCTLTGSFATGDYAKMRQFLCFTLMDNGYAVMGVSPGAIYDGVDGSNTATWPNIDEFWGGSLNLGGYLGNPLNTAQGQVQTSAWSNNVWRRDFDNGIALWNASSSPQTINVGGTHYRIRGSLEPTINTGAAVSGSFTIPASDGLILLNSSPP